MTDWICKEVHTDNGGYFEPVTELIRCKDCKYWSKQYRWCGFNDTDVELDDFCSRAERKE